MLLLLSLIFFFLTLGFLVFFVSLLVFLVFFLFHCYSLSLFVVPLCCCLLCTSMAFYTTCCDKIYHFYPLTTFGLLWVSFQDYPLVCHLPNHHHYTVLAVPCLIPEKSGFVLFFYFPWHFHLDKGWAFLLPTSIACT